MDIHGFEHQIARELTKIKTSDNPNSNLILKSYETQQALGFSKPHQHKTLINLRLLTQFTDKCFLDMNKEEVMLLSTQINNTQWSEATKEIRKIVLKCFVKRVNNGVLPDAWIDFKTKTPRNKVKKLQSTDLISEENKQKMLLTATDIQTKALISVLLDGCFRISELCNVQFKHVQSDNFGFLINVTVSKSTPRIVRLKDSCIDLKNWLNSFPSTNPEAYLFHSKNPMKPLNYATARKKVQNIQRKAGLKRFGLHRCRHTRITELLKTGMPIGLISRYAGVSENIIWRSYSHLDNQAIDEQLFKIETGTKCLNCGFINAKEAKYCNSCLKPMKLTEFDALLTRIQELENKIKQAELSSFK